MPTVTARPFALRLLVAAACIYLPFLIAPLAAQAAGCVTCEDSWAASFPFLPGLYPAHMFTDALGVNAQVDIRPIAISMVFGWVLLTAWCGRECKSSAVFTAVLSGAFAVVAVAGFAA
jgi:hypothetical protein